MPAEKNCLRTFLTIMLITSVAAFILANCTQTSVQENGQLQVIGTQLCNQRKEPVQLKGIAIMDISWFKDFVNPGCFSWLRDDWGCTVIRAVLYTVDDMGTLRAISFKDDMIRAVQTAIDTGLYVIIDWHILHDKNPMKYKNEALTFFTEMAALFKDVPNVLYEICNEPNGDEVTWKEVVKPYAEEVITAIRKIDPDNVILVGTPNWSQYVDQAADDPLAFDNIMYVCHFYAGTHDIGLRYKIDYALSKNAPIFLTEWGTTASTATGSLYPVQTFEWIDFLNKHNISWVNWSITSRKESSAAVKYNANPEGAWADSDLTESGLLVRSLIRGQDTSIVLFADGFETENFIAGNWITENTGIQRDQAFKGYIAALLKKQSSLAKEFDTTAFKNIQIQFAYKSENWNKGDALNVEWFDGNNWQPLASLEPSQNWSNRTLTLPEKANDNYQFQFRFVTSFGSEKAAVSLDEVSLIMDRIKEK
jgi:aryl-phospho-beta-D-glucosidase BglC (GH1 family)